MRLALIFILIISYNKSFSQNDTFNLLDSTFSINSEYQIPIIFHDYNNKFHDNFYLKNKPLLDNVIYFINNNSNLTIEIGCHTPTIGNETYNQKFSQRKAENFVEFLKSHDLNSNNIKTKGYGESQPIISSEELKKIENSQKSDIEINGRLVLKIVEIKP